MSGTIASAPASSFESARGELTAIERTPAAFALTTSAGVSPISTLAAPGPLRAPAARGCVADLARCGGRPVPRALLRDLEQGLGALCLAAEGAPAWQKEAGAPEPLQPRPRDRLRVSRHERQADTSGLQA